MSETRKIAAILVADVVGYSRLAGADEEGTLARLRALRSDLIDPAIAAHHGRIVKRTGDGSLIEFRSVVDAVRCSIELQNGMVARNAGLPPERHIEFRIGIHLGDVVEESDGDLMGDGVNIAARLEGIAKPGAICLSEQAYWQVKGRLDPESLDRIPRLVGARRQRLGRAEAGTDPRADPDQRCVEIELDAGICSRSFGCRWIVVPVAASFEDRAGQGCRSRASDVVRLVCVGAGPIDLQRRARRVERPGLSRPRRGHKIVNPSGGVLDVSWIGPPDAAAIAAYREKTGLNVRFETSGEGGRLAAHEHGQLTLMTEIEVRDVVKPLADWLARMWDKDLVKLRCETRSEPPRARRRSSGSHRMAISSSTTPARPLAPISTRCQEREEQIVATWNSFEAIETIAAAVAARERWAGRQVAAMFSERNHRRGAGGDGGGGRTPASPDAGRSSKGGVGIEGGRSRRRRGRA